MRLITNATTNKGKTNYSPLVADHINVLVEAGHQSHQYQ